MHPDYTHVVYSSASFFFFGGGGTLEPFGHLVVLWRPQAILHPTEIGIRSPCRTHPASPEWVTDHYSSFDASGPRTPVQTAEHGLFRVKRMVDIGSRPCILHNGCYCFRRVYMTNRRKLCRQRCASHSRLQRWSNEPHPASIRHRTLGLAPSYVPSREMKSVKIALVLMDTFNAHVFYSVFHL